MLTGERSMKGKTAMQDTLANLAKRQRESAKASTSTANLDWSCSTLSYVTDGVDFLENIDQIGLSADTIYSATHEEEHRKKSDDDEESDEEFASSQDLFDSPARKQATEYAEKERKHQRKVNDTVRARLARKLKDRLDVEALKPKLTRALRNYHQYTDRTANPALRHRAYERTVNVCASHIGIYGCELDYFVQRLELVYIKEKVEYGSQEYFIRQRFLRKWFNYFPPKGTKKKAT